MTSRCFICGEDMEGVGTREITVLGSLRVEACGPCVDLSDNGRVRQSADRGAADAAGGMMGQRVSHPSAVAFDRIDRRYPLPSWTDIAAQIGVEICPSAPGDLFAEDVDLQAYWPEVTIEYEGSR